ARPSPRASRWRLTASSPPRNATPGTGPATPEGARAAVATRHRAAAVAEAGLTQGLENDGAREHSRAPSLVRERHRRRDEVPDDGPGAPSGAVDLLGPSPAAIWNPSTGPEPRHAIRDSSPRPPPPSAAGRGRRLHDPCHPTRSRPRPGGWGEREAGHEQERHPLEALRRGHEGRPGPDRAVHGLPEARERLPLAPARPARPRLSHGHRAVAGDRRARDRRRQRRPIRPHPLPQEP